MRKLYQLTNDDVRQIVGDIFCPKKITCIQRRKREDEISCKIYTEWEPDEGEKPLVIADELVLRNPFVYGKKAIQVDFPINGDDFRKWKQFCFAKEVGLSPYQELISEANPYLEDGSRFIRKSDVLAAIDEASTITDEKECDNWNAVLREKIAKL